jgi:hypothetical protein
MKRLAVCGWDEETAALLRAISLRSDLRATAIGDDRPAALVRARTATGLPCYQHLREMLRAVDYDAVLIGDAADREALLEIAGEHRARILLRGDVADAPTLRAASDAVAVGAGGLNVLRPELNRAGLDLLAGLTEGDADWLPELLQVEIAAPEGVPDALGTAAALVVRLQAKQATAVAATALHAPTDVATVSNVQIRHGHRAISTITARDAAEPEWRIALHARAGTACLVSHEGGTTLTIEPANAPARESDLLDGDLLDLEAQRAADPSSRREDERFAPHESALLAAIDSALNTGFVATVHDPGARGTLRVLEGGDLTTSRREGHLRLLGS